MITKNMSQNDLAVHDESTHFDNVDTNSHSSLENNDEENCSCSKNQCMLGIASVAIGLGGFVLALLL